MQPREKIRAVLKPSCMNVYRTTAPKFQPKRLSYSTLLMFCWDQSLIELEGIG